MVGNLLMQYHLPHPLKLLKDPPEKASFKKILKSKVLDHWEKKLRLEASLLPSLVYFHPSYMSLTAPHRIWTTAGGNPYEVAKARVQLLFLASQYPCGWNHQGGTSLLAECHQIMFTVELLPGSFFDENADIYLLIYLFIYLCQWSIKLIRPSPSKVS